MQVIIAGAPDAPETQALMAAAHGSFAPDRVVLPIDPANQASKAWYQQHNPEAWAMIEGATHEVCIVSTAPRMLLHLLQAALLQHCGVDSCLLNLVAAWF